MMDAITMEMLGESEKALDVLVNTVKLDTATTIKLIPVAIALKQMKEARLHLFKTYGQKGEGDVLYDIPAENQAEFSAELKKLLVMKVDIGQLPFLDPHALPLDLLSANELASIKWLLTTE